MEEMGRTGDATSHHPAVRSGQPRKRVGRLQSGGAIRETVYTHFADKERLFTDLVLANTERVDEFVDALARLLQDPDDLEKDLRELARLYAGSVVQPQVLQLRRLVIGEATRFPELARIYYERVPERVVATLASRLQELSGRGLLRLDDPRLAAEHFVALVLWTPLDRAMFVGESKSLTAAELERVADAGVRVFLAAYGRP